MDKEKAIKATKNGAIAAFISAAVTIVFTLYAIIMNSKSGLPSLFNDISIIFDIILILICAFGMLKHSRAASVTIFVYFIFAKIIIAIETGKFPGLGIAFVMLYFYGKAIQGSFVYHRIKKNENTEYKPAPKYMYFVGIPLGLVLLGCIGFGIMSMSGVVPSTTVITGSKMPSKDKLFLNKKGIIHPDEEIEYFYSDGLTSITESGNILTDHRVVIYLQEDTDLKIYELEFKDIASIELIEQGNFLNNSIYEVQSFQKGSWIRLFLSTEERGDVKFIEALRSKVREVKNTNTIQQQKSLARYKPSDLFSQNNEAIVLIRIYDESGNLTGFGSGFNVHENGVILTNRHVVLSGGSYLEIKFPKHGLYEDVYIAGISDSTTDIAVLRIDGKELPKVNISPSVPVKIGDRIYTISNPEGLLNTLSEGLVSAERIVDDTTFFQITAPISKGSSGGAVFNEFGEVIGIASMIMKKGQNLNFAVSIDEFSEIEEIEEYFTLKELMDYLKEKKKPE